ncbi:hypothetical protein KXD93_16660 [Mucilaginibacter sp. BJC16-A38]|uniref:hypothetical protein n=1 Tax=Mucilaginibacter phenanthrenivorans TaxID=1234842 RepID=UPI002157B157|nr:hypothetical protein [Mucilaginibacter phenanthrenivorans]MCR8559291.1 hypothetical protein [Mucilaginibacter phenanthrenivorans]
MPKSILFISLNIFFATYLISTTFGQGKNDDSKNIKIASGKNILFDIDNENYEYLASAIERDLLGLNVAGNPNAKMFHTVVGLNFLLAGYSESERIVVKGELFDKNDHSDEKIQPSKQSLAIYNSVLEQIKNVQYFLLVKINSLNNGSLGIEFTLYQMFDSGVFDFKKLNPLKHRAISFSIDPKNDDYQSIIRMNLHQVIFEANTPPKPYILYHNKPIKDSIYVPIGNIELAGAADAPDTSPGSLKLQWHLLCEECPNNDVTAFAQTVNFNVEELHRYHVKLTVTDGQDTADTTCLIIASERPQLDLFLQLGNDFSKSRIRLYTYQKKFVPNDDSHFFNIFLPISRHTTIDVDKNWVNLVNNIQVVSSLSHLNFSVTHYDTTNMRYSIGEIQIPIIGRFDFFQQQIPSTVFIFRNDSTHTYVGPHPEFYNKFSLFGKLDALDNIPIPSTTHFVLKTYDNNNSADYNFDLQFRRKNRISPFLNYSGINFNGDKGTSINLIGIGVDYLIVKGISVEGSFGSATTKSFSSPVKPYYKLDANVNMLNFENALQFSFDFSNLCRETYHFPAPNSNEPITPGGYHLRFGFGGLLRIFPSDAKYFPFSFDVFYSVYPNGYELSNFSEYGLRTSFYFAK